MRKLVLIVLLVAVMGSAWGRYLPPDPARVETIAAALPEKAGGPTPYDRPNAKAVKSAVALLKRPVAEAPDELYLEFTRNGNRTHYQTAISRRYSNLYKLVDAECNEKQGRFIPKIVEYLNAVNNQRSWVWPAHDRDLKNFNGACHTIDLVSSDLVLKLAEVLYVLGDRLPPETVARTRAEMERRVFSLYRNDNAAQKPRDWWFFGNANWTAVCHAGVARAALIAIDDRLDRARFVEAASRGMTTFLSGFTPDGYCSEGMGYWEYGFGHYIDFGLAVHAATKGKIDVFAEGGARARAAAGFPFAFQLQADIAPHFADGGGNPSLKRRRLCADIWPDLAPALEAKLPIRSLFPDAQVFISRAPGVRPFGLAVKGGNNHEFHNHNDVGSWTLMLNGEELAGDPGGETYTARTFSKHRYVSNVLNSFGHPVPRVAGQLQPPGAQYKAKVLKTEFTDTCDTIVMDIAGAYAVKGLQKLVRTTVFDRVAHTFTVTDDVAFETPQDFDVPIITYCTIEKGADKSNFALVTKKGGRATVAVAVTGGAWELKEEVIDNLDKPGPTRLAVMFTQPVTVARVVFTLKEEK